MSTAFPLSTEGAATFGRSLRDDRGSLSWPRRLGKGKCIRAQGGGRLRERETGVRPPTAKVIEKIFKAGSSCQQRPRRPKRSRRMHMRVSISTYLTDSLPCLIYIDQIRRSFWRRQQDSGRDSRSASSGSRSEVRDHSTPMRLARSFPGFCLVMSSGS